LKKKNSPSNLANHYLSDFHYFLIIILGQMAGGRAKFIGLKGHQCPLVSLPVLQIVHPLLDTADKAKHKNPDRRATYSENGPGTVPPQRLQNIRQDFFHVTCSECISVS